MCVYVCMYISFKLSYYEVSYTNLTTIIPRAYIAIHI